MKHKELTDKIIKAFFNVYNVLGYGFLEKVYEQAMYYELLEMGLNVDRQKKVTVYYKKYIAGEYNSDLTIEDIIICELKTSEIISEANESQLINYLKATNIEVGLLLNFGKKPEIRRKVYNNEFKSWNSTSITSLPL